MNLLYNHAIYSCAVHYTFSPSSALDWHSAVHTQHCQKTCYNHLYATLQMSVQNNTQQKIISN